MREKLVRGRLAAGLYDAWQLRPARTGLLATFLIVLGSLTPAYLPQNSPWWGPLRAWHLNTTGVKILGTGSVIAGIGLLVDAWFRLRPSAQGEVQHWAVLTIWSLPLIGSPPTFSHDAYSYAAQGWMLVNGVNPYEAGPGVLPGAFADQVAWVWRFTPAPYGPLSLVMSQGIVVLSGLQPYLSTVLMRLPALVGVALIVGLLPRIADRFGIDRRNTAWFASLNPLLVIDFVGGAHNDALMMGLVVLAVWLSCQGRFWLLGAVTVGVAATIKQPAFLTAYALPLITQPLDGWAKGRIARTVARIAASCATSIATFSLISLATGLGFGWLKAVNVPGLVVTVSPFTLVGQGIQLVLNYFQLDRTEHAAIRYSRTVGLVISAAGTLLMAVTVARRRPIAFLTWSYLLIAFGGPALHSWYVLWGSLLLPLTNPSRRLARVALWTTIVLLCYSAVNLAWRNGALALGIAALGGFWWQLNHHERAESRRSEEDR